MRAFPVKLPSGARYWTVLDEDLAVVAVADGFLRHVRFGRDGAEATTKENTCTETVPFNSISSADKPDAAVKVEMVHRPAPVPPEHAGRVRIVDEHRGIELLGRDVLPAVRDIGRELGIRGPFDE